jgi:hypothetical protein
MPERKAKSASQPAQLSAERNYQFRRRLNRVHRPGRRDDSRRCLPTETAITNDWKICLPGGASEYLISVAQDLQDYLFTSMETSVLLTEGGSPRRQAINLRTKEHATEHADGLTGPRSFKLIVKPEHIIIVGFDERGIAQGCYFLEELMSLREGPFLSLQETVRSPIFSPRMVHSGWGIDQFPDQHLNAIAHAGMDAILVFVKGPNMTTTGYLDLNNLVDRAAHFGLDVYLYSYLKSHKHPDEPDAEEYYESTYGELIRSCPGAKGIIFVGESCQFPSKDERTRGTLRDEPAADGKPDPRPYPGWWPCRDYPQWLDMVKGVLRKYSPELDVVFWTYNWGWAPEQDRLALIRSLPTDISLQATFEMFENIEKNGIMTRCVDYTASFEGPGQYFQSEAQEAHQRGIPLYSMTNTGGLSWDIGVIPYQPIPFQWERRYRAILEAHSKWGLVGLMESHHFGWWPSFVSELAKWAYWTPVELPEKMAPKLAQRDFGEKGMLYAVEAWWAWSEAFRDYVPTNEDQYGPFRVGPAYPLVLHQDVEFPSAPYAHFGARILKTMYRSHRIEDVPAEIELLERMQSRWCEGVELMEQAVAAAPEHKREHVEPMLNLGRFISHCVQTTIHTKRWLLLKARLEAALGEGDTAAAADAVYTPDAEAARAAARADGADEADDDASGAPASSADGGSGGDSVDAIVDEMVALAEAEIANAEATIPLVDADSRLGWEPSMEYMCDRAHLEWKISQVREVIDEQLPALRPRS